VFYWKLNNAQDIQDEGLNGAWLQEGNGLSRKCQPLATAQPAPRQPRRTPSSHTPDEENQPRPSTTADIPKIVNAVLEARHNHPTAATAGSIILENQSPKAKPLPKIPWVSVSLFY